ncbi:UNVERIFIED_CONTAM: Fasciclin-like arabinogalactan protein 14 [Sesamum radiatum]|uniref:Fasciclin-like arabinogalactan protein 14 n=1 Tax=Sesamum radiatum TaxID=300843 RepID=A0AAW2KZ34_SESRA
MSPSTSALILVSAVLLLSSATTTSAFNVTLMLDKYPDYTEFNNLLSKTGVADEINRRQTITILALSNGHFGDISSKKDDVQKRIISTHVVLDYYDVAKLKQYNTSKGPLTTLFQTYGQAKEHQGFLAFVKLRRRCPQALRPARRKAQSKRLLLLLLVQRVKVQRRQMVAQSLQVQIAPL